MKHTRFAAAKIRRQAGAILTLAALSWVSSCASLGPDTAAAADVAVAFHHALASSDGAAACALLAPDTAADVMLTADSECAEAVLGEGVPDAAAVEGSQAFGRSAQVVMDDDVLFLAIFDGQWRITAAGCQSRGEQPYQCRLSG